MRARKSDKDNEGPEQREVPDYRRPSAPPPGMLYETPKLALALFIVFNVILYWILH